MNTNISLHTDDQEPACQCQHITTPTPSHLRVCPYHLVPCPSCNQMISRHLIHIHQADSCTHREVTCHLCGEVIFASDIHSHFERHIQCSHCERPITLPDDAAKHKIVKCPICSDVIPACALTLHVESHLMSSDLILCPTPHAVSSHALSTLSIALHSSHAWISSHFNSLRASPGTPLLVSPLHIAQGSRTAQMWTVAFNHRWISVGLAPPGSTEFPGHAKNSAGLRHSVIETRSCPLSEETLPHLHGQVDVMYCPLCLSASWGDGRGGMAVLGALKSLTGFHLTVGLTSASQHHKDTASIKQHVSMECPLFINNEYRRVRANPAARRRCPRGCGWSGNAERIHPHLVHQCPRGPVHCPNRAFGCQALVGRDYTSMSEHLSGECQHRLCPAPDCPDRRTTDSRQYVSHINMCPQFRRYWFRCQSTPSGVCKHSNGHITLLLDIQVTLQCSPAISHGIHMWRLRIEGGKRAYVGVAPPRGVVWPVGKEPGSVSLNSVGQLIEGGKGQSKFRFGYDRPFIVKLDMRSRTVTWLIHRHRPLVARLSPDHPVSPYCLTVSLQGSKGKAVHIVDYKYSE